MKKVFLAMIVFVGGTVCCSQTPRTLAAVNIDHVQAFDEEMVKGLNIYAQKDVEKSGTYVISKKEFPDGRILFECENGTYIFQMRSGGYVLNAKVRKELLSDKRIVTTTTTVFSE